jgi:TRAP-type C4-dicarboxylate transport system substrate-binding protein
LPFMISDSMKAAPALSRWYQRYASKEMADHYVCHVFTHIPGTIHSKTPIRVPADLKGLNVRTANQTTAQYVTSIGGNSVQVPIMDSYEALNRGVADSIMVTWAGLTHPAFRFGQVTSYTLDLPLYVSTFTTGISKKTFDAMSTSQKQAIASVCSPEWSAKMTSYWYEDDNSREQEIRKSDRKVVKPTPEETVLWRKAAEPVIASWKESVGKAGYDADHVMTEFQKELRDAGALF